MIQNSRRRDIAVAVRNAVEELWTHLSSRSNRSAEIHGRCARIEPLEGRTYFTSLYWDPSGAATADGGTGTWNTTSAIWRSGSPTGPLVAWSNSANSDAIFPGSNGVVTIYPAITAKSVSFNSTGYTISGGTLTLAGGYGSIDVALDATATINSTIAGTVGLTKADGGTLVLAGSNNYSGGTAVAGTLSINGSGTLGIGAVANSGLVQFTPYSPSIPTTIDLSDLLLSGGVYEVAPGVTAQLPGFLALYGGAEFVIDAGAMLQVPVNGSLGPVPGSDVYNFGTMIIGSATDESAVGTVQLGYGGAIWNYGTVKAYSDMFIDAGSGYGGSPGDYIRNASIIQLYSHADIDAGGGMIENAGGTVAIEHDGVLDSHILSQIDNHGGTIRFDRNTDLSGLTFAYGGVYAISNGASATVVGSLDLGGNSLVVDSGGSLYLGNTSAGNVINGAVTDNGNVYFNYTGSCTITSGISGTGVITLNGGNYTLTGLLSTTGGLVVNGGTLKIGRSSVSFTGPVTLNSATLDLNGYSSTFAQLIGASGTIVNNASGTLSTLTVSSSTSTFAGVIADHTSGTGTVAVALAVAKLKLAGNNTYSGGTTVNPFATLFADSPSATGGGPVTVKTGGTLAGTGTISGSVTVNNGGIVSPGDANGLSAILNLGSLTLASGANLNIDVNSSTAGTGYDQVVASGVISLASAFLNVNGTRTNHDGDALTFVKDNGTAAVTGAFSGKSEGARSVVNGVSYYVTYVGGTSSRDLMLVDSTPPHAANDNYQATQNHTLTVPAAQGVLSNDSGYNNHTLSVYSVNGSTASVGQPLTLTYGNLTLNADGSLTYVPQHDFVGTADISFYVANDGVELSNQSTVQFVVGDAPLHATGVNISAVQGSSTSVLALATFTDEAGGTLSEYSATIAWGDGVITGGTPSSDGHGGWIISDSHTYSSGGVFAVGITIFDNGGSTSASSTATVVLLPPSNVAVAATTANSISLSWTDNASGEAGYKIERSPDNSAFTTLTTTAANATGYTDTGLADGTRYSYRVSAVSSASASNSSTTSPISGVTVLPAPTPLTETALSDAQISLSWSDNSDNETGFKVQRSTDGINFTTITTTAANAMSFVDSDIAPDTSYYYEVVATNAFADSAPSNIKQFIPPPTVAVDAAASPSPVTGTTTNLSVLGADYSGESTLIYTWATAETAPAAVTFPDTNGTNAAQNMIATFSKPGTYNFTVAITDQQGFSASSTVQVIVNLTLSSIRIGPVIVNLADAQNKLLTATAFDQFGTALITQPNFTWSVTSGPGAVDPSGIYTASGGIGTAVVQAASGSVHGAATVIVSGDALIIIGPDLAYTNASVHLHAAGGDISGGSTALIYVWSITNDGNPFTSAQGTDIGFTPTSAGSYVAKVTVIGPSGPTIQTHSITVYSSSVSSIPLQGPGNLEVGHIAAFNANIRTVEDAFSSDAPKWFSDPDGDDFIPGPVFAWTARDSAGTIIKGPVSESLGTNPNTGFFLSASSLGPAPHQITINLQVTYKGDIVFQNSLMVPVVMGATNSFLKRVIDVGSANEFGVSAVELPDGKILVANAQVFGTDNEEGWTLTRLNPDLSIDTAFGNQGVITQDFGYTTSVATDAYDFSNIFVALQNDRIIVAATVEDAYPSYLNSLPYESHGFILADGERLPASEWAVARYSLNGDIDTTFGSGNNTLAPYGASASNGIVIDNAEGHLGPLQSLTIGDDASIYLSGQGAAPAREDIPFAQESGYQYSLAVEHLSSNGVIDTSFGTDGHGHSLIVVAPPVPADSIEFRLEYQSAFALLIQPNGDIIVGGTVYSFDTEVDSDDQGHFSTTCGFALIRLTTSGELDTTFGPSGSNGQVVTTFTDDNEDYSQSMIRSLGVDSHGNIIAMGMAGDGIEITPGSGYGSVAGTVFPNAENYPQAFAAIRYSANGILDTSFGSNGKLLSNFYGEEIGFSGVVAPSDDIIMTGQTISGGIVARFTPNGASDTSFGNGGKYIVNTDSFADNVESTNDAFRQVVLLRNNDILLVGYGSTTNLTDPPPDQEFDRLVVVRYRPGDVKVGQLTATAMPSGPIDLNWANLGSGQDGFEIERSTSAAGMAGSVIATVGADQTSYTDAAVAPNTTYYYQIVAFDTVNGNVHAGGISNVAHVTTAPIDTGYVLEDTVQIPVNGTAAYSALSLDPNGVYLLQAWGNISQTRDGTHRGDAEYGYFNRGGLIQWWDKGSALDFDYGIAIENGAGSGDVDGAHAKYPYWGPPATDARRTYSMVFQGSDIVGADHRLKFSYHDSYYPDNSDENAGDIPFTIRIYRALPGYPANLTATVDRPAQKIDLAWQNTAADASNILIERAGSNGEYYVTATLPGNATGYSDTSAAFNAPYSYRLIATNAFGQSLPSNIASAVLADLTPQVSMIPAQVAHLNEEFKYTVTAFDPDDSANGLHYSISGVPDGVQIDPATGLIHGWTPTVMPELGYSAFWTITVTDAENASTIVYMPVTLAPDLSTIPHAAVASHVVSHTDTTLTLSVTGTDDNGGTDITYAWQLISRPAQYGLPTFSVNGGPAAAQTIVTFYGSGTYIFSALMTNGTAWSGHSDVSVAVDQVLGSIVVTPVLAVANPGTSKTFSAQALDQFGLPMATQPTFAWSVVGGSGSAGGTISSAGVYTRPSSVTGTPSDLINVTATVGGITRTGIASVTVPAVAAAAPTIATAPTATPVNQTQIRLTVLGGNPGGAESDLIYVWSATNLPTGAAAPSFSANGTNSAKTVIVTCDSAYPLNYTFSVTIQNRQGMTVSQSVTIADNQTFTKVVITPQQSSIGVNRQVSYTAQAQDQYSRAMASQPSFSWSVTDTSNTVLHTGNGASFAYTPAVSGAQQVTATATVGSIQLTGQAGLTVIPLGPPIRQIVSIAGNADGSPVMIGSDTSINIISYNPDGTPALWALWLIPTGGGGDGTGGGPILLASGTQSVGQPGAPQQVATIGPNEDGNGAYTLVLTSSSTDSTDAVADAKPIQITRSRLTVVVQSTELVSLNWEDAGIGARYYVFRSSTPNFAISEDNEIGELVTTSFNDNTLAADTSYNYSVIAVLSDGSTVSVGNDQLTTPTHDPVTTVAAVPTGLQAIGINDSEILLTWNWNPENGELRNVLYEVQESTDQIHWFYVAIAPATATSCIVRGAGPGGAGFLQENVWYYFRVDSRFGLAWSESVRSMVRVPDPSIDQGHDIILICGSRNWGLEELLQGIRINTNGSNNVLVGQTAAVNGVGKMWADLINSGYNAYLVPDPEDGGSFSSVGAANSYISFDDETRLYSTLNNDGSGRIYDEIQYEFSHDIHDLGLVGASHGAGMTENISNRLWTDSDTPLFASVVVAETIDGIQYGTGTDSLPPGRNGHYVDTAMVVSPAAKWGGYGFNYWTPNPTPGLKSLFGIHGGPLTGAGNYLPYTTLNHSNIDSNDAVLNSVKNDINFVFFMLSF